MPRLRAMSPVRTDCGVHLLEEVDVEEGPASPCTGIAWVTLEECRSLRAFDEDFGCFSAFQKESMVQKGSESTEQTK